MSEKECRSCKKPIDSNASKCHYCGAYQNPILDKLQNFSLILSVLVALVTIFGAYSSQKDASKANDALNKIKDLKLQIADDKKDADNSISSLDSKIANAKSDIGKLIKVKAEKKGQVLDIDDKVRIQWGQFVTKNQYDQDEVQFPLPFADNGGVSISFSIIGKATKYVAGKSIIAEKLNANGFKPKAIDNRRYVASGVTVSYVAFGAVPN